MYQKDYTIVLLLFGAFFVRVLCVNATEKATNQTSLNKNVTINISNTNNVSFVQNGNSTPLPSPPSNGREGVISNQVTHPPFAKQLLNATNATSTTETPIILPINTTTNVTNQYVSNNVSAITKLVTEAPSKISPRKGVTLPESLKAATVVKKPTITENGDDDYNQSDTKPIKNNDNLLVPDNKEHKRAAYLIPIIAVIFSVPLVAAIISVLYKRGSEWWQHRHYRRMDFLIEGMYNN